MAKSSHSPALTSCCLIHLLKGSSAIPSGYLGDYFFADFYSGWIRILEPSTGEESQAGELYYLERGSTGTPASVGKIGYSGT